MAENNPRNLEEILKRAGSNAGRDVDGRPHEGRFTADILFNRAAQNLEEGLGDRQ